MEPTWLRAGFRRAITSSYNPAKRRILFQPRRFYATSPESQEPIRAAPPIRFSKDENQFSRSHAELLPEENNDVSSGEQDYDHLLRRVRIVPASPSYFTATPRFTDDFLHLSALVRKYELLPRVSAEEAPKVAWKRLFQYRTELGEPVREMRYDILLKLLNRLNQIHPSLLPVEVQRTLEGYRRSVQPSLNQGKPIEIDELGRTRAVGRRKSSHAFVFLVEGEGECLINGRSLNEYFGRLHDRESALWALKATQRLDKYNIWAVAKGGGTTGQAEAITLGVAKALAAQEPGLEEMLRQCMCFSPRAFVRMISLLTSYSWCLDP